MLICERGYAHYCQSWLYSYTLEMCVEGADIIWNIHIIDTKSMFWSLESIVPSLLFYTTALNSRVLDKFGSFWFQVSILWSLLVTWISFFSPFAWLNNYDLLIRCCVLQRATKKNNNNNNRHSYFNDGICWRNIKLLFKIINYKGSNSYTRLTVRSGKVTFSSKAAKFIENIPYTIVRYVGIPNIMIMVMRQ